MNSDCQSLYTACTVLGILTLTCTITVVNIYCWNCFQVNGNGAAHRVIMINHLERMDVAGVCPNGAEAQSAIKVGEGYCLGLQCCSWLLGKSDILH